MPRGHGCTGFSFESPLNSIGQGVSTGKGNHNNIRGNVQAYTKKITISSIETIEMQEFPISKGRSSLCSTWLGRLAFDMTEHIHMRCDIGLRTEFVRGKEVVKQ